jgi:hypothetical protein
VLHWSLRQPVQAVVDGTADFEDLVAVACGAAALLLIGWCLLITAVAVLAVLPGRAGRIAARAARRITPAVARRLLPTTLGVLVVAAPVASVSPVAQVAWAAPVASAGSAATVASAGSAGAVCDASEPVAPELPGVGRPRVDTPVLHQPPFDNRPLPEDPGDRPSHDETPPEQAMTEDVVVEPGQTLWSIAADHLVGDDPSSAAAPAPAEITTEWKRWFAANRSVIGDDPHVIRPGMHLTPPARD